MNTHLPGAGLVGGLCSEEVGGRCYSSRLDVILVLVVDYHKTGVPAPPTGPSVVGHFLQPPPHVDPDVSNGGVQLRLPEDRRLVYGLSGNKRWEEGTLYMADPVLILALFPGLPVQTNTVLE